MNIGFTILFYQYLGLVGIGLAMLFNYIVYGIYVFKVVQNKFQFNFRKNTLEIIIKSSVLGILAATSVFLFDYPIAYWILVVLCLVSLYYSYVALNERINLSEYVLKFKNKWKK
jgi:uncharacterized membrane protein YobD (UPF0266 family)